MMNRAPKVVLNFVENGAYPVQLLAVSDAYEVGEYNRVQSLAGEALFLKVTEASCIPCVLYVHILIYEN